LRLSPGRDDTAHDQKGLPVRSFLILTIGVLFGMGRVT
jgi:hypothetical protein